MLHHFKFHFPPSKTDSTSVTWSSGFATTSSVTTVAAVAVAHPRVLPPTRPPTPCNPLYRRRSCCRPGRPRPMSTVFVRGATSWPRHRYMEFGRGGLCVYVRGLLVMYRVKLGVWLLEEVQPPKVWVLKKRRRAGVWLGGGIHFTFKGYCIAHNSYGHKTNMRHWPNIYTLL